MLLTGKKIGIAVALAVFAVIALVWPQRGEPIKGVEYRAVSIVGEPWSPQPIKGEVPHHPHMAEDEFSTLHGGGSNPDVNHTRGPLGHNATLHSRHGSTSPGGMIATTVFTSEGLLLSFMGSFLGFELNLLNPRSLELLARYDLPQRPSTFAGVITANMDLLMADTSGGGYFYLDDQDRAVLGDARQHIVRIGHRRTEDGDYELYLADDWDVSHLVPHDCLAMNNWFPDGECDPITSVMPDADGRIWWVTIHGRVGAVDPATGEARAMQFQGEEIQNTFAADMEAVYILTTHALYAMKAGEDGSPEVIWRQAYDRGGTRKVGVASHGSGTSPTLLGDRYILIVDNASPRSRLRVYLRQPDVEGDRLVCTLPLFDEGRSGVELSLVAWERSIVIANTYGYKNSFQQESYADVVGGLARVNIREDESGCDPVWEKPHKNPSSVVHLSTSTGLLYAYTMELDADDEPLWSLSAIDAQNGSLAFAVPVGRGKRFDNNWAPLTLGPDGTAYVGVTTGMISIWDGE